jgi:hypothetical protein
MKTTFLQLRFQSSALFLRVYEKKQTVLLEAEENGK